MIVLAPAFTFASPHHSASDPCDAYGDCISTSMTYLRSNPDHTLYLGDSFSISLSVKTGPNTTGYSTSWSFDTSVFERSGGTFTVAGNTTGTFTITATVTFTGSMLVGNTTQPFTSSLSSSQTVTIIQLAITLKVDLVNVTDTYGLVERNPDGSFYRNDSFCVGWNATFQFSSSRPDITINMTVPSTLNSTSPLLVVNSTSTGRCGTTCFRVGAAAAYKPYDLTLAFMALNWENTSLANQGSAVPFAVVRYSPMFTTFTYMDYNEKLPTAYERPFVTLVRYAGNSPGYTYAGDANTGPFSAANSTGERALVTDFSFRTVGYNMTLNPSSVLPFNVTRVGISFIYSSSSPRSGSSSGGTSSLAVCVARAFSMGASCDQSNPPWSTGLYPATVTAYFQNGTKAAVAHTQPDGYANFKLPFNMTCTANCPTYTYVATASGFKNGSITSSYSGATVYLQSLASSCGPFSTTCEAFASETGLPLGAAWCISLSPADAQGTTSRCSADAYVWFILDNTLDYTGTIACSLPGCYSVTTLYHWVDTVAFWPYGFGDYNVQFRGYPTDTLVQPQLFTWDQRYAKWYFQAPAFEVRNSPDEPYFANYTSHGVEYFNVTEAARSSDFAGASKAVFNTTYLYEPVSYSGYLRFNFLGAGGQPDNTANVTIVSHNPSPLNTYLFDQLTKTFGNDPSVTNAFRLDTYPSDSTLELKQLQPNRNGAIIYLVNQTNLASSNDGAFPWFSVSLGSQVGVTSYTFTDQSPYLAGGSTTPCTTCSGVLYMVPGSWGVFLMNNATAIGLRHFYNISTYYLVPVIENLALPINSTLSGAPALYVNWYENVTGGPVVDPYIPISLEPGHLTTLYQLIYGQNTTINVNTVGGGIDMLPPQHHGNEYLFSFLAKNQSGGVSRLWMTSDTGRVLLNESLVPTPFYGSSFTPLGSYGVVTADLNADFNGTVIVTILNAWGGETVISGIPVTARAVPPPVIPTNLMVFFLLMVMLLALAGRFFVRRRATPQHQTEEDGNAS